MNIIKKDIWMINDGFIGITTNSVLNSKGEAILGAGLAKQAKERIPGLPKRLGECLKRTGNRVYVFWE